MCSTQSASVLIWYEAALGSCEVYGDHLLGDGFSVGSLNVTWTVYIDLVCHLHGLLC